MRALLPRPLPEVDLVEAYAVPPGAGEQRPFVRANMISSIDGAISVGGRSGGLGGPADRRVFQVLRSWCDVVLVGAGTARAERYGPVRLDDELVGLRAARGQPPVPPVAVVTRSGNLDWSSPMFTEAVARPIVFTTSDGGEGARRRGSDVAEVVIAGETLVEPAGALSYLKSVGLSSVLLEGGPGLNAEIVGAGLLDELCLTVSPRLVAGTGARVLAGPELAPPLALDVVHLLEEGGLLFFRLAASSRGQDGPLSA